MFNLQRPIFSSTKDMLYHHCFQMTVALWLDNVLVCLIDVLINCNFSYGLLLLNSLNAIDILHLRFKYGLSLNYILLFESQNRRLDRLKQNQQTMIAI